MQWGRHPGVIGWPQPRGCPQFRIATDALRGHGVHLLHAQNYANQLDALLDRFDTRYASYQVINTGTEGYDTGQARQMLEESLRFEPDFVVVGFCLNDITDPYLLDRELGGSGSYSGMQQATFPLWGYLINETGFGLLALKVNEDRHRAGELRRAPLYRVERIVQSPDSCSMRLPRKTAASASFRAVTSRG